MGIMGVLALILGLFLVYNTINAIISRQIDQIGIMKAIGARTRDILLIYLINVLMYGFLAAVVAVPLGAVAGWLLNNALLVSFSVPTVAFGFSTTAIVVQIGICLMAPLLAALIPVFSGARITVREAISSYGLSSSVSLLDRVLAGLQQIPRVVSLTISNTFRHKGRVILTQVTLVMSGLIFMMIMSVSDSVNYTFTDVIFSILRFNVTLQFEEPERMEYVESLSLEHPDVTAVEMWALDGPTVRPKGQPESDDDPGTIVFGVPLPTRLYGPQLRAGRWLAAEDGHAIVMNEKFANDEGYQIGDWVTMDHGVKGESDWQIVGLVFDPILTTAIYAPRDPVLKEIHSAKKTQSVWIQTSRDDFESEAAIAKDLRQFYEDHHLDMNPTSVFGTTGDTASGIAANILGQFRMIIMLLLVMALLIGVVGSIALSGVLSLNVLERRREIGVMRAIGASSSVVARIFIGEGLILGWLSWVIALPLSVPAGRLMTDAIGSALGGLSLVYKYTPMGAVLWLVIISVLSILASYFPARRATRISVRESLAYQ
jgi:putative ABC transport system permease protein